MYMNVQLWRIEVRKFTTNYALVRLPIKFNDPKEHEEQLNTTKILQHQLMSVSQITHHTVKIMIKTPILPPSKYHIQPFINVFLLLVHRAHV